MDAKELTRLALTVSVVKARVAQADAALRERLGMMLDPSERIPGRIGDTKIGTASKTDPKASAKVVDGEAFRAWVRETRPEEIVTVEAVRSSFEASLLKAVTECGGLPDGDGEVIDVPGVKVVPGVAVVRVVPEKGAEEVIAEALAADGLTLRELLDMADVKGIES